ncbi:MAG: hypothetical protein IT460_08920 [Planctomycetes bacterium]|nr:hypothetical protein [Planctomycetota bacterium]
MTARQGRFLRDPRDVIVALRLLVLAGLAMLGVGEGAANPDAFWLTTIVYGLTNLGYMASGAHLFATARTQRAVFLFDVLVVSTLIVLRGSRVPEFIVAYFTIVLMAAVVQGIGNAFVNALLVCFVSAAVSLWGEDPIALLSFPILAQFSFFFVVSLFMSQLAESAREQQRARRQDEDVRRALEAAVAARTADLARSVAELEAARTRLAASDRLATLGMLAAGVAHDIRNPVAAICASLDEAPSLLEEVRAGAGKGDGPWPMLAAALDDARAACDHLLRLANDLTAVARTTPAAPVAVRCADALEGAARMLRHRAKAPLSIAVRCGTARAVLADPGRLQQALLNLGSNGLDAMEGRGGTLTLAAEDAGPDRVRLVVADQGAGMTPAVAQRMFEAFFTTKPAGKGTGLGLHIVRTIVEAHDATLHVDTTPGEGTRITIEWPVATEPGPSGGRDHAVLEADAPDRGRRGGNPPRARADVAAGAA